MKTLLARKLLQYSVYELEDMLSGRFNLMFDDGVLENISAKETLLSRCYWDVHLAYELLPLLKNHHIHSYITRDKWINADTHLSILSAINQSWMKSYNPDQITDERLNFNRLLYTGVNRYYNYILSISDRNLTSVDAMDFVDIINHPEIKKIRDEADYRHEGVRKMQDELVHTICHHPDFRDNNISRMMNWGVVRSGQAVQCISIGYTKDISGEVFPYPVVHGHMEGSASLYDSMVSSRDAAIALLTSKNNISNSEYFSRRLGINMQYLHRVHQGDCGSDNYSAWEVLDEDDLCGLADSGIYYYYKGQEHQVLHTDQHLIDKTIYIRTIMGCIHPDPQGCCSRCFGAIADNLIKGTVAGFQAGVTMAGPATQIKLSLKHLIRSAVISTFELNDKQEKYFNLGEDKLSLMFRPELLREYSVNLVLHNKSIKLEQIINHKDLNKVYLSSVSGIDNIDIELWKDNDLTSSERVDISNSGMLVSFSIDFLRYIVQEPDMWYRNQKDRLVFRLDRWDDTKVLIKSPPKQQSINDFTNGIETIIESKKKDVKYRDELDPLLFSKELVRYIRQKLSVPTSTILAIAYNTMIINRSTAEYGLPKPWTNAVVGVYKDTISGRSMGTMMAYQEHSATFENPASYTNTNRLNTEMDYMLLPREAELGQYGELT